MLVESPSIRLPKIPDNADIIQIVASSNLGAKNQTTLSSAIRNSRDLMPENSKYGVLVQMDMHVK
jgi:hypothetical protein